MTELTPQAVDQILDYCLALPGEPREGQLHIEGVAADYLFNADRIAERRAGIAALLAELPIAFTELGGDSFLNACDDRAGRQWTGLHRDVEHLACLGAAAGEVVWLAPRDMWECLPGGMPYFAVARPVAAAVRL